jgi:hypothetical protein
MRAPDPISIPRGRGKFYRISLHLVCTNFGVVCGTADISSTFKMQEPHSLRSVLPTVPLCSRDGDGCHSERTAAQWLGVRPGCPQVRDGSVLRWIMCAAVGNIGGIPPLPMQLADCGLHHLNAATNHTVTLVQQFHLTINYDAQLNRNIARAVYNSIIKCNWKHSTASSWNTPSVFVLLLVSEIWMQSELLFLTLCRHDYCVSACRFEMCGRKGKVDLSRLGLRTDCSQVD